MLLFVVNYNNMDTSLTSSLQQIGFTSKQAKVYLALLELGESPVGKVADITKINRTVVYEVIEELTQLGFVTESSKHKVKRYNATPPQKIFHVARAHFENFKFLLPLFQALHNRGENKLRIEFYEGEEAIPHIFQTFDIGSERRFMASYSQIDAHFPHELKRWQRRIANLKQLTATKHLLADDKISRGFAKAANKHQNYEFRFLSPGVEFSMDLAIVDDTLAITNFKPLSIVVIRSAELARSAAILFDLAWKSARK